MPPPFKGNHVITGTYTSGPTARTRSVNVDRIIAMVIEITGLSGLANAITIPDVAGNKKDGKL